jgi:UTP--glucose-1-phosphate uridylyltransferase
MPPATQPGRRLRRAIIPLAGRATRLRPASLAIPKGLFPLVDADGLAKPVIHFILDEAFDSGIERACLVVGPGEDAPFRRYFDALRATWRPATAAPAAPAAPVTAATAPALPAWAGRPDAIAFAVQETPLGYGHAVLCGRDFAAGEPVLVMLGDHVYLSGGAPRCARQLLDVQARYARSVSAVQRTPEPALGGFGTVLGEPAGEPGTYRAKRIVEKPDVATARAQLRTPGLPAGEYLCWLGLHALSNAIFEVLAEDVSQGRLERGEVQLTGAQARLAEREAYFVHEVAGQRLDMGDPAALLAAQAALVRARQRRDEPRGRGA